MRIFGLTGGIASGKSTVEAILEERFPVIDADRVAREVVAKDTPGLAAVVAAFGPGVLLADGSLDRAELRKRIALSKDDKQRLESILHPLIGAAIEDNLRELRDQGAEVAFVSAALMLETGSYKRYPDGVILVCSPAETRLARLLERDEMNEETARALMGRQMPDTEKRAFAIAIIENDQDLETLRARTRAVLEELGLDIKSR